MSQESEIVVKFSSKSDGKIVAECLPEFRERFVFCLHVNNVTFDLPIQKPKEETERIRYVIAEGTSQTLLDLCAQRAGQLPADRPISGKEAKVEVP